MQSSLPPVGLLVAIEGIDGAGKTTLLKSLAAELSRRGAALVRTAKEPTDGPHGARLRATAQSGRLQPEQELELLLADRREHVAQVIGPTLAAGGVMLLDRYYYSTAAYQGAAGLDVARLLRLNRAFAPRPDLLLVVDVEAEIGLRRVGARGDQANHFEVTETLERARTLFLKLAAEQGGVLLDGRQTAEQVLAQAWTALELAVARKLLSTLGLTGTAIHEAQRLLGRAALPAAAAMAAAPAAVPGPALPDIQIEDAAVANDPAYAARIASERQRFDADINVHELPAIAHYWSHTWFRPMLEEVGVSHPDSFMAKYLGEAAQRTGNARPRFLSIGAGNCDTEVRVAQLLRAQGLKDFTFECLELSTAMLERGRQLAQAEGLGGHFLFTAADFNRWRPKQRYDGIMASQSLHHVQALEHLFDAVRDGLAPRGLFMTNDMIGRNGHMRWPEALKVVQRFWKELPARYHYNHQLRRHEAVYENWDCSREGFEGIRAQDILPQLLKRFHFKVFIALGNVVDIFTDRTFGHNFNADDPADRAFIDRLHAYDEQALAKGELTPTRLFGVMSLSPEPDAFFSRGLKPERCVRKG